MTTGRRSATDKAGATKEHESQGKKTPRAAQQEQEPAPASPEVQTVPGTTDRQGHGDRPGSNLLGPAGRPFWSGSITIGLVNVPVHLHTMVRDKSFSFRLLHLDDGQPLRYDRVCTRDGNVIPWADTVKGFEVRKGEFVVFEPSELKAIAPESDRKIRIEKFVYYLSLDPVYFGTPYILTPDRSEEAYNLLLTALVDLGRAAVGTITLRTKEYPVLVYGYGGGLILTTLRYADEVTTPGAFESLSGLPVPKEAEIELAKRIITDLSGDLNITDYHDTYRDAVEKLVKKKLAGEKIVYEAPHPEEARELMQALKETLAVLKEKT